MQPEVWCLALVLSVTTFSINALGVESGSPITGCWKNDLGSVLKIEVNSVGQLTGKYQSKVSEVAHTVEGTFVGLSQDGAQPTFGFVVKWSSPGTTGAISVWTGQYFNRNGKEVLETLWLLRNSVDVEGKNWDATRIGSDIFHHQDTLSCVMVS